jgi:hypothetical protein
LVSPLLQTLLLQIHLRWVGPPSFSPLPLTPLLTFITPSSYLSSHIFPSVGSVAAGDQSAFDFFRQETSHSDVVIRTDAMNNLILVCSLMTPEKVRADMIPYLQSPPPPPVNSFRTSPSSLLL